MGNGNYLWVFISKIPQAGGGFCLFYTGASLMFPLLLPLTSELTSSIIQWRPACITFHFLNSTLLWRCACLCLQSWSLMTNNTILIQFYIFKLRQIIILRVKIQRKFVAQIVKRLLNLNEFRDITIYLHIHVSM